MFRTDTKLFLIRLALRPPTDLLLVEPTSVTGGSPATGTILLSAPAPAGGIPAHVSSSDPAALVPSMVVVPPGETSATFPIITQPVSTPTDVVFVLTFYGGVWTAHLEVLPGQQPGGADR